MNQDREHLRLLSIFHYVMAGLACLLPFASLMYIGMAAMMLSGKFPSTPRPAPGGVSGDQLTAWIFLAVGAIFFVAGIVGAVLNFMAARSLAKRERRTLCTVVACLNCLHMPLGTLLGVFTLIVLARPSVKALFVGESDGSWPAPGPGYPPRAPGASPFSNPNP